MEFSKDKLEWLEFDLLKPYPWIAQAVFLKHGGTSSGSFASLNLADNVGDQPESIKVNRELVRKSLQAPHIVFANQEHKSNVVEVTLANASKLPPADALFTREKNLGLAITHADCQAAIFYDPENEVIGVAHAGYKGLGLNIYKSMIDALKKNVKTNPQNLIVCISPSLGPDHAEYIHYKTELPESFWEFQVKPKHFDFWTIAQNQLMDEGVQEKNIEIVKTCTFCEKNDYFSFRREKKTGRHATIAMMKP